MFGDISQQISSKLGIDLNSETLLEIYHAGKLEPFSPDTEHVWLFEIQESSGVQTLETIELSAAKARFGNRLQFRSGALAIFSVAEDESLQLHVSRFPYCNASEMFNRP